MLRLWRQVLKHGRQVMGGCVLLVAFLVILALALGINWPLAVASVPAALLVLLVMWRRAVPEDTW